MKYEKCETCGDIDYGRWGVLGLIGYSLIVGLLGYASFQLFRLYAHLVPYVLILGVILLLPAYWISFQEERKERRLENNVTIKE